MVNLHVIPLGEEVLSIEQDGTETVLPAASAEDCFAAKVSQLELHKREKKIDESVEVDDEKEVEKKGNNTADDDQVGARNPFEEVHRELAYACYELKQLHELTSLLKRGDLFRTESLTGTNKNKETELQDGLIASELKTAALDETYELLQKGKEMLISAHESQKQYLDFIKSIQSSWRLQAIAHGSVSSNLRSQEPLAVDCGFFSAGSRGKAALQRRTRNAARLIVGGDIDEDQGSKKSSLQLEVDESSFQNVRIAIESPDSGEILGSATLYELEDLSDENHPKSISKTLEYLQQSEFCSELFQVLSVEAVRNGELSSGGAQVASAGTGNTRNKVTLVENLLNRIAVSVDAYHILSISLISATDTKNTETGQDKTALAFCKAACTMAQTHLRNVHKGRFRNALLLSLVNKYRQVDSFSKLSQELDRISSDLVQAANGEEEQKRPQALLKIQSMWTHRDQSSYLDLEIGPFLMVRCKLALGHLTLASIAVADDRVLPEKWRLMQQSGDHIFSGPGTLTKLRRFVLSLSRHEFLHVLRLAISKSPGFKQSIHTNYAQGTLVWDSLRGVSQKVLAIVEERGGIKVFFDGQNVTRPSLSGVTREIMIRSMAG